MTGFQVDPQIGHLCEVVRYSLPTQCKGIRPPGRPEAETGFLCLDHGRSGDDVKIEVDVVLRSQERCFVLPYCGCIIAFWQIDD